jgi:hypothetical protein
MPRSGGSQSGEMTAGQVRGTLGLQGEPHRTFMTDRDFRRIALSLDGAEQGAHMGAVDFRVGGHIFATLASVKQGYGNLMFNPEQQAAFIEEWPDVFLPIAGGWGRMGMTHIRLAEATEEVMTTALRAAWKLRVEKNRRPGRATGRRTSARDGSSGTASSPQRSPRTRRGKNRSAWGR